MTFPSSPLLGTLGFGLLAGLFVAACEPRSAQAGADLSAGARSVELRARLKGVVVADGISKSEAETIAECYFSRYIGCGGFRAVLDDGRWWVVDAAIGMGGDPVREFHIDKQTGQLSSGYVESFAMDSEGGFVKSTARRIGPSFQDPRAILGDSKR